MWQIFGDSVNSQINTIMDQTYEKLNKKLDALTKQSHLTHNSTKTKMKTQTQNPRVINLSEVKFTKEQIDTLALGPNFAIEKDPKLYLHELIIDTENAIRHLDPKIQNTYRFLATKKIKQIMTATKNNTLHKRHQYKIKQIKNILKQNNLIITKADKCKAMVIINENTLNHKIDDFIKENNITKLNKDPTQIYQKQIQQTIQKCNILIDKHKQKFLISIKPTAPKLNIHIKTHKENEPIRPVINNTQAPTYKIAKYFNQKLNNLLNLPNTYITCNTKDIADDLTTIQINENAKIVTLDIKDLYVNLPIQGILNTTKIWLNKNDNDKITKQQAIQLLETILKQNYFQYNNQIYQPNKGIAMGSPISSTIAEIYIQLLEEQHVKQWLDNKHILYYKRYVDDILIIYDSNKINEHEIINQANNLDKHLQFKLNAEENNSITYLDLMIYKTSNSLELGIFRKPTSTDITIHFKSNHPLEHKLAAFNYYINRMLTLPITKQQQTQEWNTIQTIAKKKEFPNPFIQRLKAKIENRKQKHSQTSSSTEQKEETMKKWVTFKYHSPLIRKVTNLFKQTELKIALRTTNTISQQLVKKPNLNNPSGIYKLICRTCNKAYVGQSGCSITLRQKEHIRYIKTNNPVSAYALHILNNRHKYGPMDQTLELLKPCQKGSKMNCWERVACPVCLLSHNLGRIFSLSHNTVHARVCKTFLLGPVYWQGCTNRPNHLQKIFSI
jgi:hypothetical protein